MIRLFHKSFPAVFVSFLFVLARPDRFTVGYGSLIRLRNVATSLYLSTEPINPSDPNAPWAYFGTFGPCDENCYWTVGRVPLSALVDWGFVSSGSLIRITSGTRQVSLAVKGKGAAFHFYGHVGTEDIYVMWNVTCEKDDNWEQDTYVQFRNVPEGCYLAADLKRRTALGKGNQHPLECVKKGSLNSLWVVDGGLFPQDDLTDHALVKALQPLSGLVKISVRNGQEFETEIGG
jgi:hypothetical protein